MRHENPATLHLWDLVDRESLGPNAPIADLFSWAANEDFERGTCWIAFLDLIGWTSEHAGQKLNHPDYRPGYLEIEKLADALSHYADHPRDSWDLVCEIESAIE